MCHNGPPPISNASAYQHHIVSQTLYDEVSTTRTFTPFTWHTGRITHNLKKRRERFDEILDHKAAAAS